MYCTKCGKENTDVSSFCTSCGNQIVHQVNKVNTEKPAFPKFTKKHLLIAVVGLVITFMVYAAISPSQPNVLNFKNPNKGNLYFCTRWIVVGVGRMNSVTDFFYMLPDNKIYHKIPVEGLESFDLKKAQTNEPADTGTYTIADGKMKVTWENGDVTEYTYEKKNGKVLINSGELIKIDPFKKGERLEGTWRYSMSISADYNTGYSSYINYDQSLTLHADGTFEESNMSSVDSHGENNIGGSSQNSGSGTYFIDRNTIVLTYPNFSTKRMTIFSPYGIDKASGKHEFLNFDGKMFSRA